MTLKIRKNTGDVDDGALDSPLTACKLKITCFITARASLLPCCADPLALSQGIKRDGGGCNGGINSRLLAEGSEGERPLGGKEGQRPEKVPAHYIPLALCH